MRRDTEANKAKVIEELEKCYGIVADACKKVGISRYTFYNWKVHDEEFAQKVEEAYMQGRGCYQDLAENTLIKAMKGKDTKSAVRASMFVLNNLGKERGYGERIEVNQKIETASDADVANAVTNLMSGIDYKVDEDDDAEEVTDDEEVS